MAFLLFLTAFVLSGIAAYYSVIGIIAIFSAAMIPVAIMASSLEVAKLVVASWLYRYWKHIPILMKTYFTISLVVLMLITSMGIFGFLSKAHSDQSLVSGDVQSKIAVYDEKIKTSQDNIDANRKALKQLDEAVDQVMGRSTSETGADKAVAIRRSQAKERTRLLAEITAEQKTIAGLREERAPIAAEVRKVEAEVGPIKYIAAMIYGDNPDENTLERSVRWLIILLICVFDPLAVLMLIAANLTQIKSKEWKQQAEEVKPDVKQVETIHDEIELPVVTEVTEQQKAQPIDAPLPEPSVQPDAPMETMGEPVSVDPHPIGWMYSTTTTTEPVVKPKKKKATAKKIVAKKTPAKKVVAKKTPSKKKVVTVEPEPIVSPNAPELDASIERPGDYLTEPTDQNVEDKSIVQGFIPQPVTTDNQIQTMIDNNDTNGLEEAYKRIVKELGKKNRSKSTHWGPIKNNKK
jgi:cell division septum initiation protein DivIVA